MDTYPIPGQKLKFLTPPEIESGPPSWKAEIIPTTPRRRTVFITDYITEFYVRGLCKSSF